MPPALSDFPPDSAAPPISAARWVIGAATILGIVADPLLREGPWGVGLMVWVAALAIGTGLLCWRAGRRVSRESAIWLTMAVVFAAGLSWRDASALYGFDFLAMLVSLVLAAMSLAAVPVPSLRLARVRDLVSAAFGSGLDVGFGVFPLVLRDAELYGVFQPAKEGKLKRIGRALVITIPIFVVFALLLMRADPVFGSFFTLPKVDLPDLISHVVVAGFFGWVVAGWMRRSLLGKSVAPDIMSASFPLAIGATDVTVALGALNLLFAAFVVVQIGWLFGGEALVLKTTGLSYAEYARRGFFELIGVASLLLPVLLLARALIPAADSKTLQTFRRLAVPLVLLLGAIIGSAGARMLLYIRYYGISTDRLYAVAVMGWLVIVFVWFTFTVLRSRPERFAFGLMASGFAVLFVLNCLNPDALVATANLARGTAVRGGTDLRYVAALDGDAVPLLVAELTANQIHGDSATTRDRCGAARILLHRWSGERRAELNQGWTQWNAGRSKAWHAVHQHEGELQQLACAKNADEPAL